MRFPVPSSDPFYEYIEGVGQPGDVHRLREIDLGSEVKAWQVRYLSTDSFGSPIVPSGTVIVGRNTHLGQRPLVCYGPTMHGLGRDCAPSYLIRQGTEPELGLIRKLLRRGWAVAITDGQGMGTEGPHTLLAGRVAGHTMLDIARAAQRLPGTTLTDAPVGIWGYSAGGRAAVWAAELQPSYAEDVELCAVVAGGVPAEPTTLMTSNMEGPFQGLVFASLIGFSAAYRHLPLRDILNETGQSAAKRAEHEDLAGLLANYAQPVTAYSHRADPWNCPHWQQVLQTERSGQRPPAVPVHLYHGSHDDVCPVSMGRMLADDYRALGATVTWTEFDADHMGGIGMAARFAIDTLTDYFIGATRSSGAA